MDMDFLLDVRESSFERIGGVWHVELGMMFERKEPGKVRLQTPVGAPETLVCEVPTMCEWSTGFLSEKVLPTLVPKRKPVPETRLVGLRELQHEFSQFFSGLELRLACDIPKDDLDLMELTHLNGNTGKGMHKPLSGIADNAHDVPSSPSQFLHACHVLRNGFVGEELPEKIFATMRASEHHDAEHLPEVCRVHYHHNVSDLQKTRLHHGQIHLLLYPPPTPPQPLTDLRVRLFFMCEFSPEMLNFCCLFLSQFATARFAKP